MTDPKETWGPGQKSLTYVVKLEGAEVQVTPSKQWASDPARPRRYVVDRVKVTTRWDIGQEEDGYTVVRLECREIIGGHATSRNYVLYPESLDEVPRWLADIELRATPRDVG